MDKVKGYHGEWNMGSPGGWDYQRIAQYLGKIAWDLVKENVHVPVDLHFDHPQINAVPGFARTILKAHKKRHGKAPVHVVLLAEPGTLDVVLENRNFVEYLNGMEGVKASLAEPGHLSLKKDRVFCEGSEVTVVFMDFNLDTLLGIGAKQDIGPIKNARTVCDDELTCREVDFLEHVLGLRRSWPILDLCGGQGRHSLELSRRGYRDVTVVDYSPFLVGLGQQRATEEGLSTRFILSDARDTKLADESFRVIILMASSFGYFQDNAENEKILREAFRLLMPEGAFLMDIPEKDYVSRNLGDRSWHEAGENMVVCRHRVLKGDLLLCREMVISKEKGLVRDETYCITLYSPEGIKEMLVRAGFRVVRIWDGCLFPSGSGDYGCMSNRMVVIGHK